ncbi:MAG: NADH-quinone oxidoreductase subunit NuoG [Pseudomonadota bacterium]|jgi:NADH-quinone oxidoreductase subunit G
MAWVEVDGERVEIPDGDNLLSGLLSAGKDVPYFCYHPGLGAVGACRLCAVKQYQNADDKNGRLVMSCMTSCQGEMRVSVDDAEAKDFRRQIVEWLMTSHPHDCPVCDAGGQCHLQDMTVMTGHSVRKHRFPKRTHQNQDLGPLIHHEMNRCITCYRCVRYYNDYAGGHDLQAQASKDHVFFGRETDGTLQSEFAGNLAEVCPTGVFTDKTVRAHYARKWDLATAPSVCNGCAVGCNLVPGERYGTVRGVQNRFHAEVNGYFLCDRGRYGYAHTNDKTRPLHVRVRQGGAFAEAPPEVGVDALAAAARDGGVVLVGGRSSLETVFALQQLFGQGRVFAAAPAVEVQAVSTVLHAMRTAGVSLATVQDVERADGGFVLGENVSDTAPRVALALRQTAWRRARDAAEKTGIAAWHDLALRTAMTGATSGLHMALTAASRLSAECATVHRATPAGLVAFADAVCAAIAAGGGADAAGIVATDLLAAARPVVVGGTQHGAAVAAAAARVARALVAAGRPAQLLLVVPEANSLGLALLGVEAADPAAVAGAPAVVVVDADLAVVATADLRDAAHGHARLITVDAVDTATVRASAVVLPGATTFEDVGTYVNLEARAQRGFEVLSPAGARQGGWSWAAAAAEALGRADDVPTRHDALVDVLAAALPDLAPVEEAAAGSDATLHGARFPRMSHRASGRTAMNAHLSVHEPKPAEDQDSPYVFSMEGAPARNLLGQSAFFWAPSWNSVSALNKYQSRIGGPLRNGYDGVRLVTPTAAAATPGCPPAPQSAVVAVAAPNVYASDDRAVRTAALRALVPDAQIAVHPSTAQRLGLTEGGRATVRTASGAVTLPVTWSDAVAPGLVALPHRFPGVASLALPADATVEAG